MQSVKLKSELQTISHAISSASFGGPTEGGRVGGSGERIGVTTGVKKKGWKPRHHI